MERGNEISLNYFLNYTSRRTDIQKISFFGKTLGKPFFCRPSKITDPYFWKVADLYNITKLVLESCLVP